MFQVYLTISIYLVIKDIDNFLKKKTDHKILDASAASLSSNPFLHEYSCLGPPTMNNYINLLARLYIKQRHYLSDTLM